jgi:energy-coupling factor transporter ATP-binding protein EcfA2
VLLDDPLSAVDARVGSLLFFECIVSALRGRGKGVVLVTHQLQYMQHADKILALDKDGRQIFYGTYPELQSREDVFSILSASIDGGDEEELVQGQGQAQTQEVITTIKDRTDDIPDPVTQPRPPSTSASSLRESESELPTTLSSGEGIDDIKQCAVPTTTATIVNEPVLAPDIVPVKTSSVVRLPTPPALKYDIRISQRGGAAPVQVKKNAQNQLTLVSVEDSSDKKQKGGVISINKTSNGDVDVGVKPNDLEEDREGAAEEGKDGDAPEAQVVSQIVVAEDRVEGRLSFRIWKQYIMSGTYVHS